ncbi:OmpA family protein [Flavobacterium sediminilitoris]|uniref:OmpA family protein n=1 Tax=Flavobacterium sediminilitoris TaxID=2024526 RepID=A0ABY4HS91_9FLAO|nr:MULTISPECIES: OmpA family protein [Flavobacterium]UOX35495.1 OmpA family protein [Flavobacterium sediminilitoris]
MAKGVKKIKWTGEGKVFQKKSDLSSRMVIPPDEFVWFKVSEWISGTTEEDKKKDISWIWQENNRKVIIWKRVIPSNKIYAIKLPKKLCGSYSYYLEASLSGKTDSNLTGLYINGLCDKKVISSKWCTSNDGKDVRKTYIFSYGNIIHLNLETEGLNGDKLVVEIYNIQKLRSNKLIFTYTNVKVKDGEINLEIKNTSTWQGLISNIQDEEKFYIKVKDQASGKYILDNSGDEEHARFLRIKNKLVANNPQPPQNNTAVKTGQPNVKAVRYEPCKFETISITETQKKDGKIEQMKTLVFDNGKGLKNVINPERAISKTIFFGFDSDVITKEGNEKLNNTLNFLLEHDHSIITIDGYACVIGKMQYNKSLSQRRSDAVRKFFIDGKLDERRIFSSGKGEISASDNKSGADNIKYKDEKIYQEARRVDISFKYFGHSAQTIIYETIAPSHDKDVLIDITAFQTNACFREKDKHKKQIKVTSSEYKNPLVKEGSSLAVPVHSALATWNVSPLQYIWPKWNLVKGASGNGIDAAENYNVFIHSCRYFSDASHSTIQINAYPDIKWKLEFFLNLTNDLSVKWMNMDPYEHKKLQERSGKIGAEKRWKQKDVSLGFSLKAKWDEDKQEKEFKYEYEAKFKKIYDLFASIGALSDGITNKTKGKARSISPKGIPVSFAVKPPNLSLTGDWFLSHPKGDNKIVGTDVTIGLNANPLIGLEITIDLLGAIVFAAGAIVGASPGVTELYKKIQGQLKKGVDFGDDEAGFKANVDIYMDLIITNEIIIGTEFKFNTAGKAKDSKFKIEAKNKLKVELKVGIKIKGEAAIVIVKVQAYFEASASADASVTFGHGINYDDKGLYYRPELGFDGLNAKYIVYVSASLALKIAKDKHKVDASREGKYEIASGEYPNVIPPFDVIKELEQLFKMTANIPLIKND